MNKHSHCRSIDIFKQHVNDRKLQIADPRWDGFRKCIAFKHAIMIVVIYVLCLTKEKTSVAMVPSFNEDV